MARIKRSMDGLVVEMKVRDLFGTDKGGLLGGLVDCVVEGGDFLRADDFVNKLLNEGARRVGAAVNGRVGAGSEDYRKAAWKIHSACAVVSEGSGLAVGKLIREIVGSILDGRTVAKGSNNVYCNDDDIYSSQASSNGSGSEGEGEIVMDLKLQKLASLGGGITIVEEEDEDEGSEDEQGSDMEVLAKSVREISEEEATKAGVEIAFLLSYSKGYFGEDGQEDNEGQTNLSNSTERKGVGSGGASALRGKKVDLGAAHTFNLLSAVFAIHMKNAGKETRKKDFRKVLGVNDSSNRHKDNETASEVGKAPVFTTPSYTAKYKAMRAALSLVPEEVLAQVKDKRMGLGDHDLKNLVFACFVAKELEELGLPMPCGSIVELSEVEWSGLARSLWRDNRENIGKGMERFLVLLVELCVRGGGDSNLLQIAVKAIMEGGWHRSLLICCEILLSGGLKAGKEVAGVKALAKEVGRGIVTGARKCEEGLEDTIDRLAKAIVALSGIPGGRGDWSEIVKGLVKYIGNKSGDGRRRILEAATVIGKVISVKDRRMEAWTAIKSVEKGKEVLESMLGVGSGQKKERGETLTLHGELVEDEDVLYAELC